MTTYATIIEFLSDPKAPARPSIPPGGSCGEKDDAHMTYLAARLKLKTKREDQAEMLRRQAELLEQIAPGDPCVSRMLAWHGELVGAQ